MKHGVAFRKFSRPTAHRMLMLRNLVTSLFEHEQIKTTLPKARDTARLAEKMITLGKRGSLSAARQAQSFLLKPQIIPKVFGPLARRYADRPGGYTRIHKFGNRPGDNAPVAILELVDNARDIRFDMTARAIGREIVVNNISKGKEVLIEKGVGSVEEVVRREGNPSMPKPGFLREGLGGRLRRLTQANLRKVLRYRGSAGIKAMSDQASDYINKILAEPVGAIGPQRYVTEEDKRLQLLSMHDRMQEHHQRSGTRPLTTEQSAHSLASGSIRRKRVGLGLPGSWLPEKRAQLRERPSQLS